VKEPFLRTWIPRLQVSSLMLPSSGDDPAYEATFLREWASEGVFSDLKWRSGLPFRRHYIPITNNTQQYPNYHFTITATNHKTILQISIYTLRPEVQTRLAEDIQSYISDRQKRSTRHRRNLKIRLPHSHSRSRRLLHAHSPRRASSKIISKANNRYHGTVPKNSRLASSTGLRRRNTKNHLRTSFPIRTSAIPQSHMLDSAAPSGKQYADMRKDRRFLAHF
jgi:ribosomal protein S13